jgi:tetratricopeptide (TPR) repeat protein
LPLLQAIAERPEAALHGGLAHLQAAEFLSETRLFPEREFAFKHALTHEVAYGSLLLERRRVLHARIVAAMEALAGDRVAEQVEHLAHHAVRGAVWDKALLYGRQAGAKALGHSAYQEALAFFEQVLEALRHLPMTRDTHEQAIDLRLDMRSVRSTLGRQREALQDLQEAETLAEALNDPCRQGRVSSALANYFASAGPHDQAIAYAQRALALAAASGDISTYVSAYNNLGHAYFAQGDYRQAIDYTRQAMAVLEGERRYEFWGAGRLPAVFSRTYLCYSLAEVGEFAEGIAVGETGLQLAEAVQHPRSLVMAYLGIGCLYVRKGELHPAVSVLERALGLCQEVELLWDFPNVANFLGSAYVLSGRVDEAVQLLERGVREQATQSARPMRPLRSLSEAHLLAGHLEEASTLAKYFLEGACTHRQRGHEAYALRLLGEIAARRDPLQIKLAEAHYRQALALAEELGMRPLQAHCHRGLGTLYAQTGQREQARTALSTAIALYHAMDMTFWLPETEAALAQVEGQ